MSVQRLHMNSTNVRRLLAFAWFRAQLTVASAVAPARAVDTAARIFSTPPRFPQSARELEFLATGRRFEVATSRASLAAWRFGHPGHPAVLLSHGWGGRGAQLRSFVAPLIDAGFQPVLFDHAAHGQSGATEATLVDFIDGLEAVAQRLEAEGVAIAGVVGHSFGAAAAGAWLNASARPIRAVLVAPPTSLQRYARHFARRLGLSARVRDALQQRFERLLGKPWREFELPHSVARVKAPALVVHDAEDSEVPVLSGVTLAQAWPGARLLVTRSLGHRAILRDEQAVRDAVDFIADRVVFAPPPLPGEALPFGAPSPLA